MGLFYGMQGGRSSLPSLPSSEGGVTCHVERRASGLGIMVLVESAEPADVEEIVLRRTARPVDRHATGNASGRNAFESIHGPGRRDTSRPARCAPVPPRSGPPWCRASRRMSGSVFRKRPRRCRGSREACLSASAARRDRNDRNPRLQCEHKPAFLEGKEAAVGASRPFREHDDGGAPTDGTNLPLELADGLVPFGPVDEDEPGKPEHPAEYRDVKKLPPRRRPAPSARRRGEVEGGRSQRDPRRFLRH